jgi:hypothetical protein
MPQTECDNIFFPELTGTYNVIQANTGTAYNEKKIKVLQKAYVLTKSLFG